MIYTYSKSWGNIRVKLNGAESTVEAFEDKTNKRLKTLIIAYKVKKGQFKGKKIKVKIKFKYSPNGKPKWYRHTTVSGQGMTKEQCQKIIDQAWGRSISFEAEHWEEYPSGTKVSSYWKTLDHYAGILSRSDDAAPVVKTVEETDEGEAPDPPVVVIDEAVEIPVIVENVPEGIEVVTKVTGLKSDDITQSNYTETFNSTGGSSLSDPLVATQVVTNGTVQPVKIEIAKPIHTSRTVRINSSFTVNDVEYTSTPVKLPVVKKTTYASTVTSTSDAGRLSLIARDFESTYDTEQIQQLYNIVNYTNRTETGTGGYTHLWDVSPSSSADDTFIVNGTIQQATLPYGVPLDCGWGKSHAVNSTGSVVAIGAPGSDTVAAHPYISYITSGTIDAKGYPSGRVFVYNHQAWKDPNKSSSLIGSPLKGTMTGWGPDRFGQAICMNASGTKVVTISRDFNLANLRSDEGMGRNVGAIHEFNLVGDEWAPETPSPLGSIEDDGYPNPVTQVELSLVSDDKLLIYTYPTNSITGSERLRLYSKSSGSWALSETYDIGQLADNIIQSYPDEPLAPTGMPTSLKLVDDKLVAIWGDRYNTLNYKMTDFDNQLPVDFRGEPLMSTRPLSPDDKVLHVSETNTYNTAGVFVKTASEYSNDLRPIYTPDSMTPGIAIISVNSSGFDLEYIPPVCPKPSNTNTYIPVVYTGFLSNKIGQAMWMDVGVVPSSTEHPFNSNYTGDLSEYQSWISLTTTSSKKNSTNPFHNVSTPHYRAARRYVEVAIDPVGDHIAFVFGGGNLYSYNSWGDLGGNGYPGGWVMSIKKSHGKWKAASEMNAINKVGNLYIPPSNYIGPVHDAVQLVPYHLGFTSTPSRTGGDMQGDDIAFHDVRSTREIKLKNDRLFVPTVSYPYAGGKTSTGQWGNEFNQSGYRTIPNLLKIDLATDANNTISWKQVAMVTQQDDKLDQSYRHFHLKLAEDGSVIALLPDAGTGANLLQNIDILPREIIEENGSISDGDRYIKRNYAPTVGSVLSLAEWTTLANQPEFAAKFTDSPSYNVDRLPSIDSLRFSGQIIKLNA